MLFVCAHAGQQAVAVKGQLMCGNKTADGVRVLLVDDDAGIATTTKHL